MHDSCPFCFPGLTVSSKDTIPKEILQIGMNNNPLVMEKYKLVGELAKEILKISCLGKPGTCRYKS
jgi:hypothetical protein